ncbi:hypothetical protein OC835_001449 [Tilletia horrida]|nr:hypothetical protein OC835_001449 [Tilletia horrida]
MVAEKRKREDASKATDTQAQPPKKAQRQPRPPPRGKQKKVFSESFGTSHLVDLALSIASGRDEAEQGRVDHAKEVRAALDDAAKKRKVAREHKKTGVSNPGNTVKQHANDGGKAGTKDRKGKEGKAQGKGKGKGKAKDNDDDGEEPEFDDDIEKVSRPGSLPKAPPPNDGLPLLKSKAKFRAEIKQKERERARQRKHTRKQQRNPQSSTAGTPPPSDAAPTAKRRRVAFA